MASKFPEEREETGQLRTRKGHDMTWSCDKHGEPIKFYCSDHTIPLCHPCATLDHVQKQCKLKDIEDFILEMKRELEDTQKQIAEAKKNLKSVDSKIKSSETFASNHLQSVNDEINATYDRKLNNVKDDERDEIRLINEEADKEIRIINEKRERRIKACKEEAEKQLQMFKDIQAKLLSEIKQINITVTKLIKDVKSKNQHETSTMDNLDSKIERITQNDKTLVNEALQVIASLDESLSSNVHQEAADYLYRIEREVQRVKFVEGEVGGKHWRTDGYIGKWELVKSIEIAAIVNRPSVCGLISDDEVVFDSPGNTLYVTNISTEHTEKVIEGDSNMWVTSCAPVDSDTIVCGKGRGDCRGDSLNRCITLYDRQWKVIREITIPKNASYRYSRLYMFADVDRDGKILAAQESQSNIYVINPANGKIVNTITMKGKKVLGRIQALSSGDIVVYTGNDKFTVISRSGEEKTAIHCDEWTDSRCNVDKLTDTLYITYEDGEGKIYVVNQVSCDGDIQAKRIVEYVTSDRSPYMNPCLITPSGNNLVICNGDKLFVYKKRFIV